MAIAAAVGATRDCISANVSTVDPRWAAASGGYTDCPPMPESALRRDDAGTWIVRLQSENFNDPCPLAGVPPRVAADLWLCETREQRMMFLPCLAHFSANYPILRPRPRACNTSTYERSNAESVNLGRIRWKRWGGAVARGVGVSRGFHSPPGSVPVKISASDRWPSCDARRWYYRKLVVRSRYGKAIVPLYLRCELRDYERQFRRALQEDLGSTTTYNVRVTYAVCRLRTDMLWRCEGEARGVVDREIPGTPFYRTEPCRVEYRG